jgi:hypothetical protein
MGMFDSLYIGLDGCEQELHCRVPKGVLGEWRQPGSVGRISALAGAAADKPMVKNRLSIFPADRDSNRSRCSVRPARMVVFRPSP